MRGGRLLRLDSLHQECGLPALRAELERRGDGAVIEMDGGIKLSNIAQVRAAGVNLAVAGSAVYGAEDPAAAIRALREA